MINYSCIPNSSLTTWYRCQLLTFGIATLFLVLMMPAGPNSAAQETENKTLIQELSTPELQTGESTLSGYKDSGFGGPQSVGGQLQTENEFKDTAVRIHFLKRALRPWYDIKNRVKEKLGIQYGLTYTSLYQVATKSLDEHQAAGGIFALQVQWDLLGRKTPDTGSLILQLKNSHPLGRGHLPPFTEYPRRYTNRSCR
jgi:hypothetical protein